MRVLLVEDDAATAQSIELMLRCERMRVYTAEYGEEAIDMGQAYDFDVALLDLSLPDVSGLTVLSAWREKEVPTPVLVITGMATAKDEAIERGADGFYAKPFHKDALVTGIYSAVRKACGLAAPVRIGELRIDLVARKARMGKAPLFLTDHEYRALELFTLRRGLSVTTSDMNRYLFAGLDQTKERGAEMEALIERLRLKLRLASGHDYIRPGASWCRGLYRVEEPEGG